MKKFVAVLIFLTLFCASVFALTLTVKAYDVITLAPINFWAWTDPSHTVQYPLVLDKDSGTVQWLDGEIGDGDGVLNGEIVVTLAAGTYTVYHPCYGNWLPLSITIQNTTANITVPFYGVPLDYCDTVPVELSSFTAVLTAQNFVNLTWVSQTETAMLGYRVYRSETNTQADALMITESMVEATNTSTTQTYSVEDTEVEIGHTYYYWLESVDMGSSQFHGPVSVLVEGEVPPVYPEITSMKSAYPNPFKANTNIEVSVKAGESGSVTIYNILGQAVRTFGVEPGTHNILWDGLNSKGEKCGSGIYFYKLSTPSVNQTKKMVIVK